VLALDESQRIDPVGLARMQQCLVHRGPDSAGTVLRGPVGLAMRRLAIIDVAGGQQPLSSEDGEIQVVCNGEIYNYRELRAELIARGHHFQTASDCEVIVHAYEVFGNAFLTHLNGMFALALWDNRRRRLVLARDRVGIKPLYYAQHDDLFLFASEPKALLSFPGFPNRLNHVSLYQYLTYEYVPTPRSIFDGILRVRPGHMLVVENKHTVERPYWQLDLSPSTTALQAPAPELADQLWWTLRESVRKELVSDVPLGVFLSGGIDSSAVALAANDVQPGSVHTFSIGFNEPSFDESVYAQRVATYLGTRHQVLMLEPRMLWELVPTVANVLDEPLADASIIPTYLLSRFTREHVTVALGGDGGDELFAGYSTMQAHRLAAWYRRVPGLIRANLIGPLVRSLPVSDSNMSLEYRAKRFILGTDRGVAERHHLWLGAYSPREKASLLHSDVLTDLAETDTFDVLSEHLSYCGRYDDLSQVLYLDAKMYLEGDILVKVDRASMACSLEVRVPLLNTDMLEFAAQLPIGLKLHGFTRKYLLRKALAARLPADIINRPKRGFGGPVSKWLREELRELVCDLLSESYLRTQGLFNPAYVSRILNEHLAGTRDNRKLLWTLLMFQLWHQHYLQTASSRPDRFQAVPLS
jgi:asparagine synthase (glutamine-hydrolysing)